MSMPSGVRHKGRRKGFNYSGNLGGELPWIPAEGREVGEDSPSKSAYAGGRK